MAKLGELSFEFVVDGKKAVATVKNFGEVVETVAQNSRTELSRMRSAFDRVSAFAEKTFFTIQSFRMLAQPLGKTVQVANQFESSNRKLSATSKLTGQELAFLKNTAKTAKEQFSLNTIQANEFTIALAKLGQKAGDTSKTQESIARLLDLAAAQGLDAEQALVAINQAILGIDEGTDKLFQKNPSVIYAEYAKQIGTTAGKLTDQQKAQALLNAVLQDGQKVQGEYEKFLASAAGKQSQAAAKAQELQAQLGQIVNLALVPILEVGTPILQFFTGLSAGMQRAIVVIGLLAVAGWKLIPMITALRINIMSLWASIGPAGWVIIGLGAIATAFFGMSKKAEAATDALAKFRHETLLLNKQQKQQKLKDIMAELAALELQENLRIARQKKIQAGVQRQVKLTDELRELEAIHQKERLKRIKELQKQRDILLAQLKDTEISVNTEITANLESQKNERDALRKLEIANIEDEFARRRAGLLQWFREQSEKYAGNAEIIRQLELQKATKLTEINDSFVERQVREFSRVETKSTETLRSELAERRTAISRYFNELINENQNNAELTQSLQQQKIAALIRLNEQFAVAEKEINIEVKNIKIRAIEDEFQRRLAETEQGFNRELGKWKDNADAIKVIENQKNTAILEIVRDFSSEKTLEFQNKEIETTAVLLQELQAREADVARFFTAVIERNKDNTELIREIQRQKYEAISLLDQAYYEKKQQLDERSWEEFKRANQATINIVRSGWDAFFGAVTDAEMTATERRIRILEAMKNAFLNNVNRMLQSWVAAKVKEVAVHTTAESTKTSVTQTQTAARSGISLAAIAKEIGRVLVSIGTWLAQMTAKLFAWFAGMGPLGVLAGLAAVPALIASVKGVVKTAAKFKDGGVVREQVLAMIGEAGDSEAVIPLNARGAGFMAQLLPKIVLPVVPSSGPAINYDRLGQKVAEAVNATPIQINAELDALQFFRDEFPRYEKAEIKRRF